MLPEKAGFYFAKPKGHLWWRYVVCIYGTPPYLRIKAWDQVDDRVIVLAPSEEIMGFAFQEIGEIA